MLLSDAGVFIIARGYHYAINAPCATARGADPSGTGPSSPNSFLLAGYFSLTCRSSEFHYMILAISVISVMPIGIEYLRARREARRSGAAAAAASETPVESEALITDGQRS